MDDYYRALGVNTSATTEEIRRAYRILARRYHPDVNPGKASEEKFKLIAVAYDILSDVNKRKSYDIEFQARGYIRHPHTRPTGGKPSATQRFYETKTQNFGRVAKGPSPSAHSRPPPQPPEKPILKQDVGDVFKNFAKKASRFFSRSAPETEQSRASKSGPRTESAQKISILEVSVGMREAIIGGRKIVEIADPDQPYKVSLKIPPGVRNGSVLRMKNSARRNEDLVFVVRVAHHPFLSLQTKGLVADLPITLEEAINGAPLLVPTLDTPVTIQIPGGSQSGTEIRLKERGINNGENSRGDLFYRLVVQVPTCFQAVGIQEKATQLAQYYEGAVRQNYPTGNLLEQL